MPAIGPIGASAAGDEDHRSASVPLRPDVRRLDRPYRQGSFDRRQAEARRASPAPATRRCAACWWAAPRFIQQVRRGRGKPSPWLVELLKRKPPKLAAVALANKTARIAWKLMVSGERRSYRRPSALRCRRSAPLAHPADQRRQRPQILGGGREPPPAEAGACSRRSRWCDRTITRRETVRGTQRRPTPLPCLELGSRKPSWQRS